MTTKTQVPEWIRRARNHLRQGGYLNPGYTPIADTDADVDAIIAAEAPDVRELVEAAEETLPPLAHLMNKLAGQQAQIELAKLIKRLESALKPWRVK